MFGIQDNQEKISHPEDSSLGMEPIEPVRKRITKQHLFKWLFFLFFIIYILLSYYHAPILTRLGSVRDMEGWRLYQILRISRAQLAQ